MFSLIQGLALVPFYCILGLCSAPRFLYCWGHEENTYIHLRQIIFQGIAMCSNICYVSHSKVTTVTHILHPQIIKRHSLRNVLLNSSDFDLRVSVRTSTCSSVFILSPQQSIYNNWCCVELKNGWSITTINTIVKIIRDISLHSFIWAICWQHDECKCLIMSEINGFTQKHAQLTPLGCSEVRFELCLPYCTPISY